VRGTDTADTLRPRVVSDELQAIDTSKGLVQMIIGGGGTSAPSNGLFYDPPKCDVIVGVGPQAPFTNPATRPKRTKITIQEDADWVGVRDRAHSYGFARFDVDPKSAPGWTSIDVTFFDTAPSVTGDPTVLETFTLKRPHRHGEEDERENELAASAAR